MDQKLIRKVLSEQIVILEAATDVLRDSYERVGIIFKKKKRKLSTEEKESCEALTARFARLCDFLFQRIFRTIDRIELLDEGTALDRLNRMEKRGIIASTDLWKQLREIRKEIAHEYLIEQSDRVLHEAYKHVPDLIQTTEKVKSYVKEKGFLRTKDAPPR